MIHIATDLDYLFPSTKHTAKVLCGKLASKVLESEEYIGVQGNLNPAEPVCPKCAMRSWEDS